MSSSSDDAARRARARIDLATMSAARPLDALLPSLREPALPREPLHPRVLELATEGGIEWVLIAWSDPGGQRAMHEALRSLVEATLLAELSRTPATLAAAGPRRFAGLRLVVLHEPTWELEPAIRAFGFRNGPAELSDEVRAVIDAEAADTGRPRVAPASVWYAPIRRAPGGLGDKLEQIHGMMAGRLGAECWGTTPGGFSHLFATFAQEIFSQRIRPDADGLAALDLLLVQREPGVIRWLPPLVFQALCDFLPVAATAVHGARISWAQSEDIGGGFAHPPLVRAEDGAQGIHIPIGQHVLRWWMMPLQQGEEVPSFAAWLEDQFA